MFLLRLRGGVGERGFGLSRREEFVDDATGEGSEALTPERGHGARSVFELAREREDGGHEAEAVVRLCDVEAARDAGALAAGEEERGVCRDAEESAGVAAGVEAAHVEVPVVVGDDEHVALGETALVSAEAADEPP